MSLPSIEAMPDHLLQRGGSANLVKAELMGQIKHAITNHPRSLQRRIGPSELGHICARRIGYKLLGHDEVNAFPDTPWKPTIGTATHAWLEEAFTEANRGQDHARWLTELRVCVGQVGGVDITGSCDLYDRVTGTVIDWKIVGDTQIRKYKSKGPGDQYRSQIHLYGRGLANRGLPVDTVMIAFLPRNGELRDAYLWHEAWDEQIALAALQRAEGLSIAVTARGAAALEHMPVAEAFCTRCPFHRAGSEDLGAGCPGVAVSRPAPALTLA